MPLTLDSLDIILSFSDIDRGLNHDIATVSRTFHTVSKHYIDRYRKTYEYYTSNFISLDEYHYAKKLLPSIRFLVEGTDLPIHGKLNEEINGGGIIKYRYSSPKSLWTFDTTGRIHSYNDEPALELYSPTTKMKAWYQHGTQSRENNNPGEIRVPIKPEYSNEKHVLTWNLTKTVIYVDQYATSYKINYPRTLSSQLPISQTLSSQTLSLSGKPYYFIEYHIDRVIDPSVFLDAYDSGVVSEELKEMLLKAPNVDCSKCICEICTHLIECPKCFHVWRRKTCWESSSNDECPECGYRVNVTVSTV